MAQRQIIVDDIDGTEGAEVLRFGLDGIDYEVDLAGKNMARYRVPLAELASKARKVPASRRGRSAAGASRSGSTPAEREENAKIRAWHRAKGGEISDRGAIPDAIRAAYQTEMTAGAGTSPQAPAITRPIGSANKPANGDKVAARRTGGGDK